MRRGSVTKLAKAAGISQGHLSQIIAGRKRPMYSVAQKLAAASQTNPVIWLEGTPEEIRRAIDAAADQAQACVRENHTLKLHALTDFITGAA